jgi:O-antigen ligase
LYKNTVIVPGSRSCTGVKDTMARPRGLSLAALLSGPPVFLTMLWLGINSGPWVLASSPTGLIPLFHYTRTLFPLIVLPLGLIDMLAKPARDPLRKLPQPLRLWTVYGLIVVLATVAMQPDHFNNTYWGVAYLSSLAAMSVYLRRGDPMYQSIQANYLTWVISGLFLLMLVVLSREALFADPASGYTAYGRMTSVLDMTMSRSSGLARFAAVPGIIGFVLMLRSGGLKQILWGAVFIASAGLLFFMQSRGAMAGFAFALMFSVYLLGRHGKLLVVIMLLIGALAFFAETTPEAWIEYVTRGQSWEQLQTMTGRTRTWEAAWPLVLESPLWGWGAQADRVLLAGIRGIESHVHNSYLYSMLAAGLIGGAFFIAGLLQAWVYLLRVKRTGFARAMGHENFFMQVGGILAFFTVRSISEVSGPLFAVDLMVMLPAILYLGVMYRESRTWLQRRRAEQGEEVKVV